MPALPITGVAITPSQQTPRPTKYSLMPSHLEHSSASWGILQPILRKRIAAGRLKLKTHKTHPKQGNDSRRQGFHGNPTGPLAESCGGTWLPVALISWPRAPAKIDDFAAMASMPYRKVRKALPQPRGLRWRTKGLGPILGTSPCRLRPAGGRAVADPETADLGNPNHV